MDGRHIITCHHCGRSRRAGDRWGSGTQDATGRVFCAFECAWTVLFIDESMNQLAQLQQQAQLAAAAAAATNNSTTVNASAATRSNRRYRRTTRASRRSRNTRSHTPPAAPVRMSTPPKREPEWHAMVGMAALFGED